jgi:phosphopentomutase
MKVIILVLDSLGVGELPDAAIYGDEGSNTLGHILEKFPDLKVPNLKKMGLTNLMKKNSVKNTIASYGKMKEKSAGKDTITGHWEMCGVILDEPFPTYDNGFPKEVIKKFEEQIGRNVIGNIVASGTDIIQKMGVEHTRTGFPIVYTSADSVFQVAAHEKVIPVRELYRMCETARSILKGKHNVARVIARPFLGEKPGNFYRTSNRKDFSVIPPKKTILDKLAENGKDVLAVGKVSDIFADTGITVSYHVSGNKRIVDKTKDLISEYKKDCLIFSNLVDFDTVYGHRNDVLGYARALEIFDAELPEITDKMLKDDWLIITADHGCDPTTPSTDHSREHVPVMIYSLNNKRVDLGVRETFADVGETVLDLFNLENMGTGISMASLVKKNENETAF